MHDVWRNPEGSVSWVSGKGARRGEEIYLCISLGYGIYPPIIVAT